MTRDASGRRLSSGGVLGGALHTLGYFSTEVCLGSPPRKFDLIVDTGSSITAVPCSSCRSCGEHMCGSSGRFDLDASRTAEAVRCPRRPVPSLKCEPCRSNECGYSVRYTEGSIIRGRVVTDVAHFQRTQGETGSSNESVRVYFGCQTMESGMFQRQRADGILGLQSSRVHAKVPSMLSMLVSRKQAPNAFSLCLADRTGLFLLGGTPPQSSQGGALTVPFERGARALFSLNVVQISWSAHNGSSKSSTPVGGFSAAALHPTIVDSGTTFMYASTPVQHALLATIRKFLPRPEAGGRLCAYISPHELNALPWLYMRFNEPKRQALEVRPSQYMVEFPKKTAGKVGKHYCAAIFDNGRDGTVIGASIMRHREAIFDLQSAAITFVDSDCEAATPRSSRMVGAYSFASCPSSRSARNTTANRRLMHSRRTGGWSAPPPNRKVRKPLRHPMPSHDRPTGV